MGKAIKVNVTKDYELFHQSDKNRPTCAADHRGLRKSMEKYGFLKCFPIAVYRDRHGRLIVKDGQHRLYFARLLGLPVYWIEVDEDFDVAEVARTPRAWKPRDFANMHAANGKADYEIGLAFADAHRIPVGLAFALLGGTVSFNNVFEEFAGGTFKVKDRAWAEKVAGIYSPVVRLKPALRGNRFSEACMAASRVAAFDGAAFVTKAETFPDLLQKCGTRDGYLEMMQHVYNYQRKAAKLALQFEAAEAMRRRRPIPRSSKAGAA